MQDYVAAYGVHLAGTALLLYAAYVSCYMPLVIEAG